MFVDSDIFVDHGTQLWICLLWTVYSLAVESVLICSITAWSKNCSVRNHDALQRVVHSAERQEGEDESPKYHERHFTLQRWTVQTAEVRQMPLQSPQPKDLRGVLTLLHLSKFLEMVHHFLNHNGQADTADL